MKTDGITKSDLKEMIVQIYHTIEENKEYLSKLDTEIGDGDHGFSMASGFKSLFNNIEEFFMLETGDMLKKCGFELIKTIGGAAGAVFGTFFTGQAAYYNDHLKGKEILSLQDVANMFSEALSQIKKRGQAQPGDKTMIDALEPAVEELAKGAAHNLSIAEAFAQAAHQAKAGADRTKDMVGKRGRSKNLGKRGIGYIDPGAVSTSLMISTMAEYLSRRGS